MFGEALHKGQWNTKKTEALMKKADTNQDGQISVDEWLSMYQPFLDTASFSDGQFEMRLTSFRAAVCARCTARRWLGWERRWTSYSIKT